MSISAFPKIFALGQRPVQDIFNGPVEITEKLDGSQIAFGKIEGELIIRSKGRVIHALGENDMFKEGWDYIHSIEELLPEGRIFYGEYFKTRKHNTLTYGRIPINHIAIFGQFDIHHQSWVALNITAGDARVLGFESVPVLSFITINSIEEIHDLLERESFLGGPKIEGFVVKNYAQQVLVGGQYISLMAGKYVSEAFKEVHNRDWKKENTKQGKWEVLLQQYRTEARWNKAIQYLNEQGELEHAPRDIGKLIPRIQQDIMEECKDDILQFLWKEFGSVLLRNSIHGFPEYYKQKLLENSFGNE